MNKLNQVSVVVTNPDSRDLETHTFSSPELAIDFLKERKIIEDKEEKGGVQAQSTTTTTQKPTE